MEELASQMDVLNMKVQEMNMIREIENLVESIKNEEFQKAKFEKQLYDTVAKRNFEYQEKIPLLPGPRLLARNSPAPA